MLQLSKSLIMKWYLLLSMQTDSLSNCKVNRKHSGNPKGYPSIVNHQDMFIRGLSPPMNRDYHLNIQRSLCTY